MFIKKRIDKWEINKERETVVEVYSTDIDLFRIYFVRLNILFWSKVFYLVFDYVFQLEWVLTNEEMNNE